MKTLQLVWQLISSFNHTRVRDFSTLAFGVNIPKEKATLYTVLIKLWERSSYSNSQSTGIRLIWGGVRGGLFLNLSYWSWGKSQSNLWGISLAIFLLLHRYLQCIQYLYSLDFILHPQNFIQWIGIFWFSSAVTLGETGNKEAESSAFCVKHSTVPSTQS